MLAFFIFDLIIIIVAGNKDMRKSKKSLNGVDFGHIQAADIGITWF